MCMPDPPLNVPDWVSMYRVYEEDNESSVCSPSSEAIQNGL